MAKIENDKIYTIPIGIELAALDDSGGFLLYTQDEWCEGARPHFYFDSKFKELRYSETGNGNRNKWPLTGIVEEDFSFSSRSISHCTKCNSKVWERNPNPAVDDDVAWNQIALEHFDYCEWVTTRGFRLN